MSETELDRKALKEAKDRLTEWLRVCDEEAFHDFDELSNDDIKTILASLEEAEGRERRLREALKLARPYVADMPILGDADLAVIDAALSEEEA